MALRFGSARLNSLLFLRGKTARGIPHFVRDDAALAFFRKL